MKGGFYVCELRCKDVFMHFQLHIYYGLHIV